LFHQTAFSDTGVECQFGNAVSNQVQVRNFLHILGENLEETRVVHRMVVVMAAMDIQGLLGHCPGGNIEHIGKPFSHGGIKRFMHIGYALSC
jgi:hypothetical protein